MSKYIIGILAGLGLFILVIVVLVKVLTGGSSTSKSQALDLNSFSNTDTTVQMTIDGPITANQTHQALRITVGQSQGEIQIIHGYEGRVVQTKSYDNNSASYNAFLHALTLSGYALGSSDPKLKDQNGYCPDGDRYIFTVNRDGKELQHYWATSCGHQGNYKGSVGQTLDLFQKQIPDYDNLTTNVNI